MTCFEIIHYPGPVFGQGMCLVHHVMEPLYDERGRKRPACVLPTGKERRAQ